MSAIAVIPARGGSQRIPRKNIRDFKGQPMLAHAIQCAQESGLFDHVFVSTDDEEIAGVARAHGADVHYRSHAMAADGIGTQSVMRSVIEDLLNAGIEFDVACCLYPCVPLLEPGDLVTAKKTMEETQAAYVFSVGTDPLHDAGQFYIGWTDAFLSEEPLVSPNSIMYPMPKERDIDVNTEDDWKEAERKYDALRGQYVH